MAEQQLPVWNSKGVEPPANLQRDGWQPGVKPPAQYFDWLFNRAYECLEELQAITEALETNKANGTDLTSLKNTVTKHLDEFNRYVSETSGKHIHSSGSNANGSFIKFETGEMICFGWKSALSGWYLNPNVELGVNYPAAFTEGPIVIPSAICSLTHGRAVASVKWSTGITFSVLFTEFTHNEFTISSSGMIVNYIAIGRWK